MPPSVAPVGVGNPVQFRTAVNRNLPEHALQVGTEVKPASNAREPKQDCDYGKCRCEQVKQPEAKGE
jgi:hypothetical protein